MQSMVPLACFLSVIRPPGVQYENALLQIAPVDKSKCPFVKDSNDIAFQLYTRHNPTVYQELMINDDERLFASNMDFHAPTVIYFHAFMEQPDDGSGIMVREAYMQRGDTNVIMVDAQRLEAGPWYFTAAQNTWYIGRFAAQFIDYMVSRGLNLNNTHLVGHSLGAQAAGVAGSAIKSGRVSRITGLDPALPLFSGLPLEQRLDISDAEFVDVIHTDAGIFGYKEAIGHADFFPNGGKSPQPGCELEVVIPQQLLLNKCDGTEQTRGYYTYYLKSNAKYQLESEEYSALYYMILIQTSSQKINSDLSRVDAEKFYGKNGKYSSHMIRANDLTSVEENIDRRKTFTNTNTEHNNLKYFTPKHNNNLRKKRVQRNVKTITYESNDLLKKGEQHSSIYPYTTTSNNGNISIDNEHNDSDQRNLTFNDDKIRSARTNVNNFKDNGILIDINNSSDKNTTDALNNGRSLFNVTNKDQRNPHKNKQNNSNIYNHGKSIQNKKSKITSIKGNSNRHTNKRQKRFLQLFRSDNEDNFIFKALNFLVQNGKNVVPVISVVRDINTLVKSGNGELNHVSKERNSYIGVSPPDVKPVTYTLELGNESKLVAFVKRLFGLSPNGDRLTIGSG